MQGEAIDVALTMEFEASDDQLVSQAVAGCVASWEELVRRFTGLLQKVARSHGLDDATSADVVQTTWLRAAERLYTLRDPGAVRGWLATIARRESQSALRKRRREPLISCGNSMDEPDPSPSPEDETVARDLSDRLHAALLDLPARERQLLVLLMDSRRPSYTKVSAALNMPVGSIGPTRARTLAHLHRKLTAKSAQPASC
jgi:RNA polymerase sigma factor (sigma-70 family)